MTDGTSRWVDGLHQPSFPLKCCAIGPVSQGPTTPSRWTKEHFLDHVSWRPGENTVPTGFFSVFKDSISLAFPSIELY